MTLVLEAVEQMTYSMYSVRVEILQIGGLDATTASLSRIAQVGTSLAPPPCMSETTQLNIAV